MPHRSVERLSETILSLNPDVVGRETVKRMQFGLRLLKSGSGRMTTTQRADFQPCLDHASEHVVSLAQDLLVAFEMYRDAGDDADVPK